MTRVRAAPTSEGMVRLVGVAEPLAAALAAALSNAGWAVVGGDGERGPLPVLLHSLDGSPARLDALRAAVLDADTQLRAHAVALAGADAVAQATQLALPASWALLPWPPPPGWLPLTLRRAMQLADRSAPAAAATANAGPPPAASDTGTDLAPALRACALFDFEYDLADGLRRDGPHDAQTFGTSPRDLGAVLRLIHPDDREPLRDAFQRCRATGCRYRVEVRLLTNEGNYRWVRSVGSVVGRSSRHPGRLLGVTWDIHDEREAREAARSARQRLDQALTTAGMLSWDWVVDDGRRRVVGNGLGLPASDDPRGTALDDLICAEDLPRDLAHFANAVNNVERYQSELRVHVPGLGTRWLQLSGYPRRGASGQVIAMSGIGLDVTRQRAMASELSDARALLIDSLQAGRMYCWEQNLIDGSRRAIGPSHEILGTAAHSMADVEALIHPDDAAAVDACWQAAIQRKSTYECTYRIIQPSGDIRWMHTRGNPILDVDGKVARISGVAVDISEQRRVEQQLANSLTQLERVQNATHVLLWEWTRTLGARCYQSGGREVAGSDLPRIHPGDRRRVLRRLWRCARSNEVFDEELRVSDGHGGYRWIAAQGARSVVGPTGELTLSGVIIDVSARKHVAEELSLAQERLRRALDAAKMVCWDWHTDSDSGGGRVSPYTPTVAGGGGHSSAGEVHPDDRERHHAAIADAISGRTPSYRCEFRVRRADGSVTWLLSLGSSLRDSRGRVIGLTGVAIDISAQKGIEGELAESREWQRLAVEAGELNLWQVDVLTGERRSGGLDRRLPGDGAARVAQIGNVIHPQDRERVGAAWRQSIETGAPFNIDYRVAMDDHVVRWLRVRGKCVRDATSGLPQMVGASMDITEQVQLETELRNAVRLARAASEAKSAFLASISHELRTPLNAVIGFSGLLLNTATDQAQSAHLLSLNAAANLLYSLINDVLDFSRIEAGEMAIERTPFSLQECLETAIDMVAGAASSKGLSLLMTTSGAVNGSVVGDPTRLRQVAVNLLANATKFTARGMVTLELDGKRSGDHLDLNLRVRDTGIGMTAAVLQRLFEPFRQGDVSTTRRFGGTGLGLSICKRLIGLMQGSIEVHSQPGVGSCFEVRLQLPLATTSADPMAALTGLGVAVATESTPLGLGLQRQIREFGAHTRAIDGDGLAPFLATDHHGVAVLLAAGASIKTALAASPSWPRRADGRALPVVELVGIDAPLQAWVGRHGERHIPLAQPVKPRLLYRALTQALEHGAADAAHGVFAMPARLQGGVRRFADLRVLVAEDNEINQTLILLQLQSLGVAATLAGNGSEALDALRGAAFDVVLMDVEMPGMDGLEAATRIRNDPALRGRTPYVIAVTAHVLGNSRQRFIAAGMDDLISKPVIMDELRAALDRALAQSRPAAAPATR